ncbi:MAG TPA: thiamine pyrophosphate-binding protein [Xanthobacteraceae bacterium]|jgi:thiamine pyrophosphate-dependent acetolactate synthase large subunit-like protein|nr:thiamine pyrophosphate-binding protein [Xanthobacteraceae bacterium]
MTPAASAAATTPATTTADTALQRKSRHAEQVAAHAADGYARQTGKLGCVVSTAGPGCTNAMTGIATAFCSESPERVADMISMAAREAFDGAPGPVYLEIPRDIEKLADIPVNSKRPAILYGQQIWAARGHEDAIALLPGVDVPGHFNGGSRALPPPGDPHRFDRTRGNAFSDADVIVVVIVGTPFDFRMGYGQRISTKLELVQIDMNYRTVGENRDIDLGQVGDPGAILGAVLHAASGRIKQHKRQARQQWMKKLTDAQAAAT